MTENKSQSLPSSHIESSGKVSLGRWCDNERITWGIKVWGSRDSKHEDEQSVQLATCHSAKTQPVMTTHLDNDQITNTNPKTLDRNRRVKTPRRPPLTKRQSSDLIETSFGFFVVVGYDRSGEGEVCFGFLIVVVVLVVLTPNWNPRSGRRTQQRSLPGRRIRPRRSKRTSSPSHRSPHLTCAESE